MANWQVVEEHRNESGAVLRRQVVMAGLAEAEARALAAEMASTAQEPPEGEGRLAFVAEEAV